MVSVITGEEQELQIEGGGEDDNTPVELSPEKRVIYTKSSNPEVKSLYENKKKGRLDLQPLFQRKFVWDRKKASRLIESVLLDIPLPIIYLAEEPDGRLAVIDGQQRLTSFFSFIDGTLPDGSVFRLTSLTAFPELNKKTFAELEERYQDKVREYALPVVTILRDSDPDLRFEIFERLNTGAEPLNDMELRNCIYRGRYITVLKELSVDPDFLHLLGFKRPDDRMRDVEFVLRFAAFYHAVYLKYQPPMKRFFNHDMDKYRNISKSEEDQLRKAFQTTVLIVNSLFGEHAFKRYYKGTEANPAGSWEQKRINAALYDVLMGTFCDKDKNQVFNALDRIREALIELMATDEEFNEAILLGTSDASRVRKRFDKVRLLVDDILKEHPKQPRCFTKDLKREFFEKNPTCAICGNEIQSIDDAAVDHIEQYWTGGKTIPENARLAHRYCNWARPRKDQATASS